MTVDLQRRVFALPIVGPQVGLRRKVLRTAALVAGGDLNEAEKVARSLAGGVETDEARPGSPARRSALSAAALSRLYIDLATAGWTISIEDAQVYCEAPGVDPVRSDAALKHAKQVIRDTMLARVREQVSTERRLIEEVEPKIQRLIADGPALAAALEARGADAVKPYLQLARRTDGVDSHTGLELHSVYRYFRYWWAFPYNDTPGRSLPILIRDAGQPDHPVCGLLCLSSPLLRLTDRDDALCLTPAWVEAAVATLVSIADPAPQPALQKLDDALSAQGRAALGPTRVHRSVASLLRIDLSLKKWTQRASMEERVYATSKAAAQISADLVSELRGAIDGISLDGLGVDIDRALAEPETVSDELRVIEKDAKEAWVDGRRESSWRGDHADLQRLFLKKRARQLAELLLGWSRIAPLRAPSAAPLEALASLCWQGRLTAGSSVQRGVTDALLCRKVRLASSQIVDVSLCGAVPPYNGLLGGKLAAMLALSGDAAALYRDAYDGKRSEIQSRMSGRDIVRPAELVALTTTSFYGVGSSQYNRVVLPDLLGGHRWDEVGETRGHGTLHLSAELCRLLQELLIESNGCQLITSTFGEGPSERLRKLRDGLTLLGLNADRLLQHGFNRIVYIAEVGPGTMPGAKESVAQHHINGPSADGVAGVWRLRWLVPRLGQAIAAASTFDRTTILLSQRFAEELEQARQASLSPAQPDSIASTDRDAPLLVRSVSPLLRAARSLDTIETAAQSAEPVAIMDETESHPEPETVLALRRRYAYAVKAAGAPIELASAWLDAARSLSEQSLRDGIQAALTANLDLRDTERPLKWYRDGDRWRASISPTKRLIASYEHDMGSDAEDVLITLCRGSTIHYTEPYEEMGTIEYGASVSFAIEQGAQICSQDAANLISRYSNPPQSSSQSALPEDDVWLVYAVFERSPKDWDNKTRRGQIAHHEAEGEPTSLVCGDAAWGIFLFGCADLATAKQRSAEYAQAIIAGPEESSEFYAMLHLNGDWGSAFPQ